MNATELFIQQLLTGLSNGMIIALIALGYTMVYGVIELINFAHGDLFMVSAFGGLTAISVVTIAWGAPPFVTIFVALTVAALLGASINVLIERVVYRPLYGSPRLIPLVAALGVSFILINVGLLWGGIQLPGMEHAPVPAAPKSVPDLLPTANLLPSEAIFFSGRDLFVFVVTLPLLGGLWWLVQRTGLGLAMRAVAQDRTAAILLGISPERVIRTTFALGGALAGIGAVVFALYNNTVHFQMGFRAGLDAFTAAVVGGIGSLPGAVCGGILIGVIRALSDQYLSTAWSNSVVFLVLMVTLVFRPTGFFGFSAKEKV